MHQIEITFKEKDIFNVYFYRTVVENISGNFFFFFFFYKLIYEYILSIYIFYNLSCILVEIFFKERDILNVYFCKTTVENLGGNFFFFVLNTFYLLIFSMF